MKKRSLLIALFPFLLVPGVLFAASGKAIIPSYLASYTSSTNSGIYYLFVSNVTSASISITITFYDQDGTVITDGDDSTTTGMIRARNTSANYDDNPIGNSVSFDLNGNSSAYVYLQPSTQKYGYGTIEWTQSGDAVHGLLANAYKVQYKNDGGESFQARHTFTINQGMPF